LQDQGYDTVDANLMLGHDADERDYTLAARMLEELGVKAVRLITNNPLKIRALEAEGIRVSARVPLAVAANAENAHYLLTKAQRMQHLLPQNLLPQSAAPALSHRAHDSQRPN
jgi:GTP cyclohydrolase II